jgi:diguanylate cyclase (GGDEF)-like protein
VGQKAGVVRYLRGVALVAGLALLVLSVVTALLGARSQQTTSRDASLRLEVAQQTDAINDYFDRSRTIALLLAHNSAFAAFYTAPGTAQAKIHAGGPLIDRVNQALAYLQDLYPERIDEACFIDRDGAEIARVVRGVPAKAADLDTEEAKNAFFGPTFAVGVGHVYQARAYISTDTHQWVISNSTVIGGVKGKQAIVHFEVRLGSFGSTVTLRDAGNALSIVDAASGQLWVDSREETAPGHPADQQLTGLIRSDRNEGLATVGGRRLAYHRLDTTYGNANHWYVVISRPLPDTGWTHGIGAGTLALAVAALITIVAALASLSSYQRSIRQMALFDPLTALPNRIQLTQGLAKTLLDGEPVRVLVVDLDRFKDVNDALGHALGDELLRQVADRLRLAVGSSGTVARLGADEFAIVQAAPADPTDPADTAAAIAEAERLLAVLDDSFFVGGVTLEVEASIGIAIGSGTDELLRHAEAAMFTAKRHHNGIAVFDPAATQYTPGRLELLGDLRRALDSPGQLIVHYQPKVALASGELIGAEALARWQHPARGMISPGEFIPAAESTTLIHRLTVGILDQALEQAGEWQRQGRTVPVAVNLSTRCLHDADLPAKVLRLLDRHELPASLLQLEITESTIMADPERALRILHALHGSGISLAIDDFGTGYSSMAYLKQLPVDELKIDQSFVRQMNEVRNDAVLVRSVVELGHNLGLAVVAEGVETAEVYAALAALGCDIAQGYHLGRPMPAEEFTRWEAPHSSGLVNELFSTGNCRDRPAWGKVGG